MSTTVAGGKKEVNRGLKVLFLPAASLNDPASRYRVYQYLVYLRGQGITCHCLAGVSDFVYTVFAPSKGLLAKAVFFGLRVLARLLALLIIWRYDVVFIQRLALPHVYPLPEVLICKVAKLLGKRTIFDYDDAIFTTYAHRKRTLAEKFADPNRVARVIAGCHRVIAGNSYLAAYARFYSSSVVVIPTTIDLTRYPAKTVVEKKTGEPCVIGWIGTPSTLPYLSLLKPVFQEIASAYQILIRVVGGQNFHCPGVRVEHLPWSLKDEVGHILSFDIGVMPLPQSEYERGKCGLKLLQYMAAGIPAVASPVGVNSEIVKDGVNGYLAFSHEEWVEKMRSLMASTGLRREIGQRGRETVERSYSVEANLPTLVEVLKGTPMANAV